MDELGSAVIAITNAASNIEVGFTGAILYIQTELTRPSILFKPALARDGNAWCALLGSNLMEGVAAFGDSPDEAMRNFDKAWVEKELHP